MRARVDVHRICAVSQRGQPVGGSLPSHRSHLQNKLRNENSHSLVSLPAPHCHATFQINTFILKPRAENSHTNAFNNSLVFGIYEERLGFNNEEINSPIKNTLMTNKHSKMFSPWLVTRKIQTKTRRTVISHRGKTAKMQSSCRTKSCTRGCIHTTPTGVWTNGTP